MTECIEQDIFVVHVCVFLYTYINIYIGIYIYREVWGQDSSRHKTFILWEGINLSMTFHFHLTFQKTWLNSISWHCNWFSPKDHLSENKLGLDLEVYILWLLHSNWYFKRSPPFQKYFWEYQGKKKPQQLRQESLAFCQYIILAKLVSWKINF